MNHQQNVQIKVTDDVLSGKYCNNMQIGHTKEEFVMDFINLFPPGGIVNARVITSPGHLKRILEAIKTNINAYEEKFGEIKEADAPASNSGIGFQMPHIN